MQAHAHRHTHAQADTHTHTRTHTDAHTQARTRMQTLARAYAYAHTRTDAHTHTCIDTPAQTHTHAYRDTDTYARTQAHTLSHTPVWTERTADRGHGRGESEKGRDSVDGRRFFPGKIPADIPMAAGLLVWAALNQTGENSLLVGMITIFTITVIITTTVPNILTSGGKKMYRPEFLCSNTVLKF